MARIAAAIVLLVAFGLVAQVRGEDSDDLVKENQELKVRVKALEDELKKTKEQPVLHDEKKEGKHDHKHDDKDSDHKHDEHKCGGDHKGHKHGCGEHPKDRFDFFRPFHSHCDHEHDGDDEHEDGHEHGDADGHKHEHGAGHEHSNGHKDCFDDNHGNGHGNGHDHEGHDRHESVAGYPFFHPLITDHAFIERKVEFQFFTTRNLDQGRFDETGFNAELFWALNNRIAFVAEVPLIYRNAKRSSFLESGLLEEGTIVEGTGPETVSGGDATGIGDLEVGLRFVAFNSRSSLFTVGLNVLTPTGNQKLGLGEGHTALEPVILNLFDFGQGTVIQTEFGIEVPVDKNDPGAQFIYNVAIGQTFLRTANARFFQYLTPFVEFNGVTFLNGDQLHQTNFAVTPGLHWEKSDKHHFAFGGSIPVVGPRPYDCQILAQYIRHF